MMSAATLLTGALWSLGGACAGALVTRWILRRRSESSLLDPTLRVVSEVAFDRRRSLALVESPERTWLLGLCGQQVTLLSEMKSGGDVAPPAGRNAFGKALTRTLAEDDAEDWKGRLDAAANRVFGGSAPPDAPLDPVLALASASPSVVRHATPEHRTP